MKWKDSLLKQLINELKDDENWGSIIIEFIENKNIGVHLAVFNEPFLSLIYEGEKKIESRFSINKIAPFQRVYKDDLIVLKESGGMVSGVFLAGDVKYFKSLDIFTLRNIEKSYSNSICSHISPDFWSSKKGKNYATLIDIAKVKKIKPFKIKKIDRSSWSILIQRNQENLFKYFDHG